MQAALRDRRWYRRRVTLLLAALLVGCDDGGGWPPDEEARRLVAQLGASELTDVEAFTDNHNLAVIAARFPEVTRLIELRPAADAPMLAAFGSEASGSTERGDRMRALLAFALERKGATPALPALRAYLGPRSQGAFAPSFFSVQAVAHAVAVLSGGGAKVRSLYDYDLAGGLAGQPAGGALVVSTPKGTPIEHLHPIGPKLPPAAWTSDLVAAEVQARNDIFLQKTAFAARFEDEILVLEDATRSYGPHTFTFRRDDTRLPDPAERYHVLGEAVPGLLADEGLSDVTDAPSLWRPGDVIVFYDPAKAAGTRADPPVHSGRLSSAGIALSDPGLRFTSKWSVTLPVVNVSVRDATKLYGTNVRIYAKVQLCAAEIRAGENESCALRADGTVWCWGSNQFGQLGNGSTTDSATPVQVQGLAGAVSLAVGQSFACAARADGSVWCWGANAGTGALGDGTTMDRSTPVQVSALSAAVEVAAAGTSACARRGDGSVFCWGADFGMAPVRMVTAGPPPNNPPRALVAEDLTAGPGGFSATASFGLLWGWDGQGGDFPGDRGSSWVVGGNPLATNAAYPVTTAKSDLARPPTPLAGALGAAAIGRSHACALVVAGAISCWGSNDRGQLGRATADGGYSYPAPVALAPALEVAAGDNHGCARTSDGVWCWGGQTRPGAGGLEDSAAPVKIMAAAPAGQHGLAGGARHTCALAPDGVWCWGSNLFGQLGSGADGQALAESALPVRAALACQ